MNRITGRGGPFALFHQYPSAFAAGHDLDLRRNDVGHAFVRARILFQGRAAFGQSQQYIASKIALAFLAFTGAETLLKYPMGALADKYGPRRFVIGAMTVCSITPILMTIFGYLFKSYWPFIPLRAVDGLAAAALWPAMSALMSRAVPREAKATAMSVFNAAYVLGLAVGPAAGLLLGYALKTNLYVFPFTALVMMIGLGVALKSIPPEAAGVEMHGESIAEETAVLRGRPMLVRMMALYALSQVGVGIMAPTVFLYLSDQFGIEQADLPRILPIPALLVLAIAIPLGRLPDKIGQAKSVWISYVLAAVGMLLIAGSSYLRPIKARFRFRWASSARA